MGSAVTVMVEVGMGKVTMVIMMQTGARRQVMSGKTVMTGMKRQAIPGKIVMIRMTDDKEDRGYGDADRDEEAGRDDDIEDGKMDKKESFEADIYRELERESGQGCREGWLGK